jgi:hypothetical protein
LALYSPVEGPDFSLVKAILKKDWASALLVTAKAAGTHTNPFIFSGLRAFRF